MGRDHLRWLDSLSSEDTTVVGGKNAALGEMLRGMAEEGIRVPGGFATTADAYRDFLDANGLDTAIRDVLAEHDAGRRELREVAEQIRELFARASFPEELAAQVREAYAQLGQRHGVEDVDVAVRSSATAEDLPEASFAGQQETYLNVTGAEAVLQACKDCYASLFTERALHYRAEHGFDHAQIALSVGVQKMVRADEGGSGVLFTIDTDTGFPESVLVNAAWGLGENVVGGEVIPDQYTAFKPFLDEPGLNPVTSRVLGAKEKKLVYADGGTTENVATSEQERRSFVLDDAEILQLARWGKLIERRYERPMDVEWAKDGMSGELFVVQARPETVESRSGAATLSTYELTERGKPLISGLAIGQAVATGRTQVITSPADRDRFETGNVLVTPMTDPDWVPIMRRASGVVTDRGGRTSHAAIVSRELGVPAVVGTGEATTTLPDGSDVTLSCVEGDEGYVYEGVLDYQRHELDLGSVPETRTRVMMNVGSPAAAMRWWQLPARGVGLARVEYLVNNVIKVHPMALVHPDRVEDEQAREQIAELTAGYRDGGEYFVDHLAQGIATIAASRWPDPVVVRLSDFKTNEYAGLIGGAGFEPVEENPMLGWRGAARYYSEEYEDGFALECRALRRVRQEVGFTNTIVMVPFCRTPEEADRVLATMGEHGLERGQDGLKVYVMAELPSNIAEAEEFARRFDGFSIGSNDLTQLALGIGRDDPRLTHLFDERSPTVQRMVRELVEKAHAAGRPVGICGQAPSDHPEFADFLVEQGIDSLSLNPDSVVDVVHRVSEVESRSS